MLILFVLCELCSLVHLHAVEIWNFSLIRSPSTTSPPLQKMGKANNVQEFIYLFKLPFHSLFYKVFKKMLTIFASFNNERLFEQYEANHFKAFLSLTL